MTPPTAVAPVLISDLNNTSMRIPIQIGAKGEPVSTHALIDSGAEGQFIDVNFAKKNKLPLFPLKRPIPVRNVDNTLNSQGPITHCTWRTTYFNGKRIFTRFLITALGKQEVILGLPWLRKYNPVINWAKGTLELNRVSMATQLAKSHANQEQKPLAELVPAPYHKYLSQFEKKSAKRFPISRSCDHKINLDDTFVPTNCKNFPMDPMRTKLTDDFIEDNLRKGYIRPSTSPQASPFFWVDKKDSTYRGVQDYRKLNEHTISDRTPIPCIEDLLEKLQGAKYFTKIDLRSGYNLVRIVKGDEWKTAFKCRYGHFEYKVMPFGLTNAPAVFQHLMNDIFRY